MLGRAYSGLPAAMTRVLGPPLRLAGGSDPRFIARLAGTYTDAMLARSDGHSEALVERYAWPGQAPCSTSAVAPAPGCPRWRGETIV